MDSAKSCHAVVLRAMEWDKCSWSETDKLDRFRRQHAQRHVPKVTVDSEDSDQGEYSATKVCQYHLNGRCTHKTQHITKGTLYLHPARPKKWGKGKK